MNVIHYTRIEGGLFTSRAVRQLVASLEGANVEVMLRKRRSYRSLSQNAYYWGVVVAMIAEHMRNHGVTGRVGGPIKDEECHDLLRAKFLTVSVLVNPDTGECMDATKSTTELTKSEFGDYLAAVKAWALDIFELDIPDPNEQLTLA